MDHKKWYMAVVAAQCVILSFRGIEKSSAQDGDWSMMEKEESCPLSLQEFLYISVFYC